MHKYFDTNKSLPYALLGLLLLVPHFCILLWGTYYVPGPDQAMQIQGAQELFLNGIYRSASGWVPENLARPNFLYLENWPIGYAFFLYVFLKLGFTMSIAAKVFQISTTVLGVFSWSKLACTLCENKLARLLFIPLLAMQFLTWGIYSTGAMTWALCPMIAYYLFTHNGKIRPVLLAALLAALSIAFRYQNLIFIPAIFLWLTWIYWNKWKDLLKFSLAGVLLPIFTYTGIFLVNKMHTGHAHALLTSNIVFHWNWAWPLTALSSLTLGASFRIDDILAKLLHKSLEEIQGTLNLIAILPSLALAYIFVHMWRLRRGKPGIIFFTSLLTSHLGLLFGLAIVIDLQLIDVPRYYHFIFTGFLLLLCSYAVEQLPLKIIRLLIGIGLLTSFLFVTTHSIYRKKLSDVFNVKANEVDAIVRTLHKRDPATPIFVVADHLFPTFSMLTYYPAAYLAFEIFGSNKAYFSEPTILVLVHDRFSLKQQFPSIENAPDLAREYGMSKIPDTDIDIYWRKFSTGRLIDQRIE